MISIHRIAPSPDPGSGCLRGLEGGEMPLAARIFAVADGGGYP